MIEITSEKEKDNLDGKWVPFKKHMVESLYNNTDEIYVKTEWGDVYKCSVLWEQGHGENYYFGDHFGNDIRTVRISDVTHYIKIS